MKYLNTAVAVAALFVGSAGAVSAHTVSFGYLAGTNAGEVEFWFGSYHGNGGSLAGIPFESQMVLQGENGNTYGPQNFSPTLKSLSLPTGLVTGDNYFYADTAGFYENNPSRVVSYMGVIATGLNAGDYSFQLEDAANTTAFWAVWDDSIGAPFSLASGDIGGGGTDPTPSEVPLPAAGWMLLVGLGALGGMGRAFKRG